MIGFDAGDVTEHDPDTELDPVEDTKPELTGALGLVLGPKGKGTRRSIYVEGPGGPTNGDWDKGEILRALKAAKMLVAANPKDAKLSSLKKYVDEIGFKKVKAIMRAEGDDYRAFQRKISERFLPLWHDGAWWRATASQLEGFKKEGYSAAEVDNLSELFELDSQDHERRKRAIAGLIGFYTNHYKPAFDAGKVPPLVMKNLTGETLVAVGAAFGADMAMFADFHIFEIDDKYSEPSRKANKKARDEENEENKKLKEAIEIDIRRASGALRIAAVFSYISGKYCAEGAYELPEVVIAKAVPEAVFAMVGAEAAAGTGGMTLSRAQRLICERVINVFETGSIRGDYANISIDHDGPHRIRQVTYGRAQTTEYGNLRHLVQMYVDNGGRFADDLRPFVALIGRTALVDNEAFKRLLRRAGREDSIMASTQDVFFDTDYFQPALRWASAQGFSAALSMLVIYDSFVHSGGMRDEIRSRFPELPPAAGGDEKAWISQYVAARHQ